VHQGDFGLANLWLNTAFAAALNWLSVTGVISWWMRRPERRVGIPPKVSVRRPTILSIIVVGLCLLPMLGVSVACIFLVDRFLGPRLMKSAVA
jgi:uncharacterized iron-regulated membrane protein